MSTTLWTLVAVVLVYASVVAHETAHALAMRRMDIRMVEIGLGLRFWPRLTLPATSRRPFTLSLSPWLITAYVQMHPDDEDRISRLTYRDAAWISGAGIIVNLVLGIASLAVAGLAQGQWLLAAVCGFMATLLWLGRRGFVAYIVPALALPMTGLFVWIFVDMYSQTAPQVVGNLTDVLPNSPISALTAAAVVSLVLGLGNLLPFAPLDGGRIVIDILHRRFGSRAKHIADTAMRIAGGVLLVSEVVLAAWLLIG